MADRDALLEYQSAMTAGVERVSLREKIGLGLGKAVVDGTHGTLHVLISPVYNMTMGLNPALISTVVFIQRIWDAMLDPLFGQFSDNFRSRWGRRLPLVFAGSLPLAVMFAALWWFPVNARQRDLFAFLLIVSLAFYAAHSLFAMPLGGLIVEATDNYHERTRLAGVTLAFGFAVQIGSQWIFPVTQLKVFGGTVNGVRWVSAGCAVLFLMAGLAPVLLCRERMYKRVAVAQQRMGFIAGLRAVRDNHSFLLLLGARGVFSFGFNVVAMLGSYMYYYLVFGGNLKKAAVYYGFIGSSYHVAAIVTSVLVYPWLQRAVGKRRALQIAASAMLLGCVAKIFFYQPGWKWLPMFVTIANGISNAGVALMATAMLGDIADEDELKTGLRREGLFSALLSWFDKAGNSLGTFLTGFILVWIGFVARPAGTPKEAIIPQTALTLGLMKFCYVIAPAIGAILTILLIHRYGLSQARVQEVKEQLAQRRAIPFARVAD